MSNTIKQIGPAVIDTDRFQKWYQNDQLHRLDGPAILQADGAQEWWQNDQRHRLDRPAVIYPKGRQFWFIQGKNMTDEITSWMKKNDIIWPWDQSIQTQFLLAWG
jgi:hypothetical protein